MISIMAQYIGGQSGDDSRYFHFEGYTKMGRGSSLVRMSVMKSDILKLAEALKHTSCPGHAAWHVQYPENKIPCSACKAN